jgi:hypothetical protein
MVYLLAIAACLFFYPKQSLQWFVATMIAGWAAGYVSFTYYNHDITWFILHFVLVYAPIMWLFELLNKRAKVRHLVSKR